MKILEHTPPGIGSSCHRITARILKFESADALLILKEKKEFYDSTWNYAKLFVYRPRGAGAFVSYDLYLGDSVLCRIKNNSKQELKITKKGLNTLWARTEAKTEIPIDIEYGRKYYLRCTIGMGLLVGHPQLLLVDPIQGSTEYNSINVK